ncbi:MAG: LptF/LptG family permease [Acidobacteria bacterium]|nr:LptF/LptG family permease [Acidobacteriota bacterium]
MRILDRYVLREILPPFVLSLLILTFVLTLPPVMKQLEQLVAKGVSWDVAVRIIATLVPQALGLTIPIATLLGILIGLGRLSGDRESVALLACGVSPYRLLRPVLLFAVVMAGATAYVMFEAIPDANQRYRDIIWDIVSKKVENDIQPRVFFDDFQNYVLYVRDVEPGGGWKDVFVADTTKADPTTVTMAATGRLFLDREQRRVELILGDGTRYQSGRNGESQVYRFFKDTSISLSAEQVFGRQAIPRTVSEKGIAELRADGRAKLNRKEGALSPHPEIIYIQQKFSLPAACLVFAIIGIALGLSSAREGKMGAFVVGFAVVFGYYAVMEIAAAQTRGHYRTIEEAGGLHAASFLNAHLARWWPNIIMGIFGICALVWRARFAHRGLPASLPVSLPRWPFRSRSDPSGVGSPAATGRRAGAAGPKVIVVIRLPRMRLPGPGLLDRYVSLIYLRVTGLAFVGLLGLFYISAFLDRSEKIFKGDASVGLVLSFLFYSTPQFVYYVIPLAVLLSVLVTFGVLARSSELTVMKACGISLYRVALPVVAMSLVGSAVLFGLEQRVLADANRKMEAADRQIRRLAPQNLNPLNRRWIVARDGSIYHYEYFDAPRQALTALSIYTPATDAWRLATITRTQNAEYRAGAWTGRRGWVRDYAGGTARYQEFAERQLPIEPPDYFGTGTPIAELMTVQELRKHIADLSNSGVNVVPLAVELQRKIAFPFVTVVMSLLAVPFGVTTGRRGALYGIGIGIVLALAYWIVLHVFLAIGGAGLLPPFLAGWSANIIVAGAAAYLFLNTRT